MSLRGRGDPAACAGHTQQAVIVTAIIRDAIVNNPPQKCVAMLQQAYWSKIVPMLVLPA